MRLIQSIKDGAQSPPAGIATLRLDLGPQWIEHFEPGFARMHWDVDPKYFNLEGAVICSWCACLADQAIFYATNTLLDEDQVTRIVDFNLRYLENIRSGRVSIEAKVEARTPDTLYSRCKFLLPTGNVAVLANATSRIIDAQN